jgi:hypothetical protein
VHASRDTGLRRGFGERGAGGAVTRGTEWGWVHTADTGLPLPHLAPEAQRQAAALCGRSIRSVHVGSVPLLACPRRGGTSGPCAAVTLVPFRASHARGAAAAQGPCAAVAFVPFTLVPFRSSYARGAEAPRGPVRP